MVASIDSRREAIAALCLKHGVAQLHVFGSALRDDFRPGESDVDPWWSLAPWMDMPRLTRISPFSMSCAS